MRTHFRRSEQQRPGSARAGSVLVYATAIMVALCGIGSLAVEYGRVRLIKTEMQNCADAAALAAMGGYADSGTAAGAATAAGAFATANPVDKASGVAPTLTYVFGTWNPVTRTFTAGAMPPTSSTSSTTATTSTTSTTSSTSTSSYGGSYGGGGSYGDSSSYGGGGSYGGSTTTSPPSSTSSTSTTSAASATNPVPAVQVIVSRSSANGNPVALPLGSAVGMSKCDVRATAVATLIEEAAAGVSVPATANTFFAGMPTGTSNEWGDSTSNAKPYGVTAIPVVPGTWITITGASGTTSIVPGATPYVGPDGEATRPLHHGQNYDGSDWGIGSENGIADAAMPGGALAGLFLSDDAPTVGPTPATVDWVAGGRRDQPSYSDLQLKAPFHIGDGKTSGGTVQRFLVPPGATRLFLSVWDGTLSSNNAGSLTATVNLRRSVRLVK